MNLQINQTQEKPSMSNHFALKTAAYWTVVLVFALERLSTSHPDRDRESSTTAVRRPRLTIEALMVSFCWRSFDPFRVPLG
jgi:hypothetical protein